MQYVFGKPSAAVNHGSLAGKKPTFPSLGTEASALLLWDFILLCPIWLAAWLLRMQHDSLSCWPRTSWWCYSLSTVLSSRQGCLSSMDVTLLKALFPNFWRAFNENLNKTDYPSSGECRRCFCSCSSLVVIATSRVLSSILRYGEGRDALLG